MIRVLYEPESFSIRISGHAGAGQAGTDIVCAGISALSWTLIAAAKEQPEFHAQARLDEWEPVMELRCRPEERFEERCAYLFSIIWQGLLLLEESYPNNVSTERRINHDC